MLFMKLYLENKDHLGWKDVFHPTEFSLSVISFWL